MTSHATIANLLLNKSIADLLTSAKQYKQLFQSEVIEMYETLAKKYDDPEQAIWDIETFNGCIDLLSEFSIDYKISAYKVFKKDMIEGGPATTRDYLVTLEGILSKIKTKIPPKYQKTKTIQALLTREHSLQEIKSKLSTIHHFLEKIPNERHDRVDNYLQRLFSKTSQHIENDNDFEHVARNYLEIKNFRAGNVFLDCCLNYEQPLSSDEIVTLAEFGWITTKKGTYIGVKGIEMGNILIRDFNQRELLKKISPIYESIAKHNWRAAGNYLQSIVNIFIHDKSKSHIDDLNANFAKATIANPDLAMEWGESFGASNKWRRKEHLFLKRKSTPNEDISIKYDVDTNRHFFEIDRGPYIVQTGESSREQVYE